MGYNVNSTKTITQRANEALDKLRQVGRDQQQGNIEFVSDNSRDPSKIAVGKLFKIGRNNRGLRLYIRTPAGTIRIASWRLPREAVDAVLAFIYSNNYVRGTHVRRSTVA